MVNDEQRRFPREWAKDRVRAEEAWKLLNKPGSKREMPQPVIVAVVDSGVAKNHDELKDYLMDAETVLSDRRDDDDHGTLIAGTIVRASRGALTPDLLRILPVKFCSQRVWPSPDLAAAAIEKVIDSKTPPQVIVLAWDVGFTTDRLMRAIDAARDPKIDALVVVAAGNMSLDIDRRKNWPASYGDRPHVVTVMASDKDDTRASFSNYGPNTVDIAAPGTEILSTVPYADSVGPNSRVASGYRLYRGSSAAAAQVAALAAVVRAYKPALRAHEVKALLRASPDPDGQLKLPCKTRGVIDYEATIAAIVGSAPASSHPKPTTAA